MGGFWLPIPGAALSFAGAGRLADPPQSRCALGYRFCAPARRRTPRSAPGSPAGACRTSHTTSDRAPSEQSRQSHRLRPGDCHKISILIDAPALTDFAAINIQHRRSAAPCPVVAPRRCPPGSRPPGGVRMRPCVRPPIRRHRSGKERRSRRGYIGCTRKRGPIYDSCGSPPGPESRVDTPLPRRNSAGRNGRFTTSDASSETDNFLLSVSLVPTSALESPGRRENAGRPYGRRPNRPII